MTSTNDDLASEMLLATPAISASTRETPAPAAAKRRGNGLATFGFHQLRSFVLVAERGSLSKVARELGVWQSSLSLQMSNLEHKLGVQLLRRSASGVVLTKSGRIFYERALAILRHVEDARAALRQSPNKSSGAVTLGLLASAATALAIPVLSKTIETFPDIALHVAEYTTQDLCEYLASGKISLAVLEDNGQLNQFVCKPLVRDGLYLIEARDKGKTSAGRGIALAKALTRRLVLPTLHPHGIRQCVTDVAARIGAAPPRVVAEVNSIQLLKSAVLAGMGATIAPLAPFQSEIKRGELRARKLIEPEITRALTLCASRNVPMTHATRAVSKLVVLVARRLCERGEWPGAEPIFHDNANLAA